MTLNKRYKKFIDTGVIDVLNESDILLVINTIKSKHVIEARSLIIALYYTGARPVEILDLKAKDIKREGQYVTINVRGSKRGKPRVIHLRYKFIMVKELYKYASGLFENYLIFNHFRDSYKRVRMNKKGIPINYIEITNKLRYHFNKWFKGDINPYFLRHNRFSKLAIAGITDRELRTIKGSKTFDSIEPYIHLSSHASKNIAKKLE